VTRVELYAEALGVEVPDTDLLAAMIAATIKRIKEPGGAAAIPNVIYAPPWALDVIKQHLVAR